MTTEYYQIPSQQGLLPLDSADSDPWLAATSSLSLSDWSVKGKIHNPPSLFGPEDVDAVSWKHVVPMGNIKLEVKAPKAPKAPIKFNSVASKIDAWSVVDNTVVVKQQKKQPKLQITPAAPATPTSAPTSPTAVAATVAVAIEDAKPIEDELTHQNRYKTELCKSFTETGNCRYGVKCQFAHGKEEIRSILRHPKYKTETCKTFHTTGTCPYGIRCRFIHTRSKEESILTAVKPKAPVIVVEEEEEDEDDCETTSIGAPPGIPVPQWSKSWTLSLASAPSKITRRVHSELAEPEPAF